jgi:hypothetical protein
LGERCIGFCRESGAESHQSSGEPEPASTGVGHAPIHLPIRLSDPIAEENVLYVFKAGLRPANRRAFPSCALGQVHDATPGPGGGLKHSPNVAKSPAVASHRPCPGYDHEDQGDELHHARRARRTPAHPDGNRKNMPPAATGSAPRTPTLREAPQGPYPPSRTLGNRTGAARARSFVRLGAPYLPRRRRPGRAEPARREDHGRAGLKPSVSHRPERTPAA